eukprot:2273698-Prymnesium_polylepis.1
MLALARLTANARGVAGAAPETEMAGNGRSGALAPICLSQRGSESSGRAHLRLVCASGARKSKRAEVPALHGIATGVPRGHYEQPLASESQSKRQRWRQLGVANEVK